MFVAGSRARDRAKAAFLLRTGAVVREPIDSEEAAELIVAVHRRQTARFGLTALHNRELNALVASPRAAVGVGPSHTATGVVPPHTTLVNFAAALGRHEIVGALLRAGADPSVGTHSLAGVPNVSQYLKSVPMVYAVWVACQLHECAGPDTTNACAVCGHGIGAVLCHGRAASCGHVICHTCEWCRVLAPTNSDGGLPCAVCGQRLDGRTRVGTDFNAPFGVRPPAEVLIASHRAFLDLPETLPDKCEVQSRGDREAKVHALPLLDAARARLGDSRDKRAERLAAAAANGDALRVVAVVEAGCNVNAVNEYGQSPLFLAAWGGHADAVSVLLAAGADRGCREHSGASIIDAALAGGHIALAEQLDESKAGVAPLSLVPARPLVGGEAPTVRVLVNPGQDFAGAGAYLVDGAFDEPFLRHVETMWRECPTAPPEKCSANERSYFCDTRGEVRAALAGAFSAAAAVLSEAGGARPSPRAALPRMRFLTYKTVGGALPAHTDLSRTDAHGNSSTHTFILYLQDCARGGETVLLDPHGARRAVVTPKRGRLFVFPHITLHEGLATLDVPKVLLRGECL